MRHFVKIAALVAAFVLGMADLRAQTVVELKMVPTDSLVNFLTHNYGRTIYYAYDADDKTVLTVKSDEKSFFDAAMKEIRSKGYSVSVYDDKVFVLRGQALATALPEGYFSQKSAEDDIGLLYVDEHNTVAAFQNMVYEIGDKLNRRESGSGYVKGHVRSSKSGEALIGVAVVGGKSFAMTDDSGYYCVKLPVGENKLNFSGYSLDELELKLLVYGDGDLDVMMNETVISLKAAVVSSEKISNHMNAQMGVERINVNFVKTVPAAFGEADIIRAVTTLPGVKTVGEAATGFNVRGGSVDQNLILFNDGIIYNPSHMFGIISAFDTDVVSNAELFKSSIPAEYGGRISSVLDIKSRTGNAKKLTGSLGLGLLTSRGEIEGPLGSENTTFILGGRVTYSDWMMKLLPKTSGYSGGRAFFADANLGITHKFSEKDMISANAYWSMDRFRFCGDTTFNYSNASASLKYRHIVNERTSVVLSAGYDRYSNSMDDASQLYRAYNFSSNVNDGYFKINTKTVLTDRHAISYGGEVIYTNLMPGVIKPVNASDPENPEESMIVGRRLDTQHGIQPSLYVSDAWTINDQFTLDMGARLSSYASVGEKSKFYCYPELRFSGRYSPMHNLSFKAGFNSMTQYIHLISNSTNISPMDTWQLCNDRIRPQLGYQAAAGVYYTLLNGALDLSLEGYYKRMYRYLDYKSGATLTMNPNLPDELVETTGRAYGVEFMAKKTTGKLTGWVSYTYSRSKLRDMGTSLDALINNGKWYNAPFDKPHDLKFVGNYKFTHRFSLSCNMDYSTGRPVTIPLGRYRYGGGWRFAYSERNAYRIPDYFRMDLAMIIEPSHNLRKLAHFSMTFGCYNITARRNAYSVYYTTNGGSSISGHMISVFAYPIPYVNFNLKF